MDLMELKINGRSIEKGIKSVSISRMKLMKDMYQVRLKSLNWEKAVFTTWYQLGMSLSWLSNQDSMDLKSNSCFQPVFNIFKSILLPTSQS
jgi:hypothetical protein